MASPWSVFIILVLFLSFQCDVGQTDTGVVPVVGDQYTASAMTKLRSLALKEFSAASPLCGLGTDGQSIYCWHTSATQIDDDDRSFQLYLPSNLATSRRVISIAVHQDIWGLLDNGDLVFWFNAGGSNTTFLGNPGGFYPPWNIASNYSSLSVSIASRLRPQVGYIPGPFLAFRIYPDSFPSRGRDVCVIQGDGELSCFTLALGTNTTFNTIRALRPTGTGASGAYYDVSVILQPDADFCGPTVTSVNACVSTAGPFTSLSFMPFPLTGAYSWHTSVSVSSRRFYTGSGKWMMVCGNRGDSILCAGTRGFIPDGTSSGIIQQLVANTTSIGSGTIATTTVYSAFLPKTLVPAGAMFTPATTSSSSIPFLSSSSSSSNSLSSSLDDVAITSLVQCLPTSNVSLRPGSVTAFGSFDCTGYTVVAGVSTGSGQLVTERTQQQTSTGSASGGSAYFIQEDANALGFGSLNVTEIIGINNGTFCMILQNNGSSIACATVLAASPSQSSPIPLTPFNWPVSGYGASLPAWLAPLGQPYGQGYVNLVGSDSIVCALRQETLTPNCFVSDGSGGTSMRSLQGTHAYPIVPQFQVNVTLSTSYAMFGIRATESFCLHLMFDAASGSYTQEMVSKSKSISYALQCFGVQHSTTQNVPQDLLLPTGSTPRISWATAGFDTMCVLESGVAGYRCWGTSTVTHTLSQVDTYSRIAYASNFLCAIKSTGNREGFCVGDGFTAGTNPGGSTAQAEVVAGDTFGCFVDDVSSQGYMICIGRGADMLALYTTLRSAQGGRCTADSTSNPKKITITYRTSGMVAGGNFLCAIINSVFKCYGRNEVGQLNIPANSLSSYVAGYRHACGLTSSGSNVKCWGATNATNVPASYVSTRFEKLVAMQYSTCGITTPGDVLCWGLIQNATQPYSFSIAAPAHYISVASIADRTFSVGLAGGSDTNCLSGTSSRCATLAGAILASTSLQSRIQIFNTIRSGNVSIGANIIGLVISAGTPNATIQWDDGLRQSSDVPSFLTIAGHSVSFRGIAFQYTKGTTVAAPTYQTCREVVWAQGRFISFVNVSMSGFSCSSSLVRYESTSALGSQPVASDDADISIDDGALQNVNFTSSTAPTFVVLKQISRFTLSGVTASFTNKSADFATFAAVTSVRRLTVASLRASGFNGRAPLQGSGVSTGCRYTPGAANIYAFPCDKPTSWYCGSLFSIDITERNANTQSGALSYSPVTIVEGWGWSVSNIDAVGGQGALICMTGVSGNASVAVSLSNSTFSSINTGWNGGAIAIVNNDTSTGGNIAAKGTQVSVSLGPAITLNSVRSLWGAGGLLYISATAQPQVNVNGLSASSISSWGDGGSFWVVGGNAMYDDGSTSSSSSYSSLYGNYGDVNAATVSIASSSFINSTSFSGNGGVLFASTISSVSLRNVYSESVAAPLGSGGFLNTASVRSLSLTGVTIKNATAAAGAGVLVRLDDPVSLSFSQQVLQQQQQQSASVNAGSGTVSIASRGAVALNAYAVAITSCVFADELTYSDGGALNIQYGTISTGSVRISMQDSSVLRSRAPIGAGGGIVFSSLSSSSSSSSSAALFPSISTSLVIQNSNFTNCSSSIGGAIYASFSESSSLLPVFTITNTTFDGNTGDGFGGAIFLGAVKATLSRNIFRWNRAGAGGGIYSRASAVDFSQCIFQGNNATVDVGGAFAAISCSLSGIRHTWTPLTSASTRLSVWNDTSTWFRAAFIGDEIGSLFSENTAAGDGGALYVRACQAQLNYTSFVGNSATALFASTAATGGGAVAAVYASATTPLALGAAVFVGNSASGSDGGGAVLLRSTSYMAVLGDRPSSSTISFAAHTLWLVRALAYAATSGRASSRSYANADWLARKLVFSEFVNGIGAPSVTSFRSPGTGIVDFTPTNVSVVMISNSASTAYGGDVRMTQAPSGTAQLVVRSVVSIASSALRGGGSIELSNVDGLSLQNVILNGTSAGGGGGVGTVAGFGGSLYISQVRSMINLINVTITRATANSGGGMYLSRVVGTADPSLVLTAAPIDSFTMSGVVFDNNTAWASGGDIFLDLGGFPTCTACTFVRSSAGISGNSRGTTARGVRPLVSVFDAQVPNGQGVNVTAAVIVGDSPVSQTLVGIQVIDAFGGDVQTEEGTLCSVLSYNNITNELLPQAFRATYGPGTQGVVNIFPYRVGVGPGTFGRIVASCVTATGRSLGDTSKLFYTEGVQIIWSSSTLASDLYLLTSTKANVIPPERNIQVQVVDGTLSPMNVNVSCSLSIDSAKDKSLSDVSVVPLTPMTRTTIAGTAAFDVAFQTDSGATISLSASCLWQGYVIAVKQIITVYTVAVGAMWGPFGPWYSCDVVPSNTIDCVNNITLLNTTGFTPRDSLYFTPVIANNVSAWNTYSNVNELVESTFTQSIEALPSSSDETRLFAPSPRVSILQNRVGAGGYALATTGSIPCSIAVDALWARAQNIAANATIYQTDAVTAGTSSVTTVSGTAVFSDLGVRSVGFGALIPLLTQCQWPTGESLLTSRFIVRTKTFFLTFLAQPLRVLLPSGLDPTNYYIMPPVIVQAFEQGTSTIRPQPAAPVVGLSLPCSVRLLTVSSSGSEVPSLVGTAENASVSSTGQVVFANLGIYAAPGSIMRLSVTCTWISGAVTTASSDPILISPLSMAFLSRPPSFTAASGPVASLKVALFPGPLLQLQGYDAAAYANNITKASNITGKVVPCTVSVHTIETPPDSALPQAVGSLTVNSDVNGLVSLNDVGINGALGAVVQLVVKCSWVSGSILTSTSNNITLSPLQVVFSTPPPSTVLPSGASSSTLVLMSVTPAVKLQAFDAASGTYSDVIGRSVPCSVGAELVDTSLDAAVQVVGTTDYNTNATNGIAVLSKVGVFGPINAAAVLVARCTWVSGSVVEGTSRPFLLAPIAVVFATQPPLSVRASGTGGVVGTSFPLSPAPTVKLQSFDNATQLYSDISGQRIQCAVSVELMDSSAGSAQFVGTTDYATSVATGLATLNDVAVSGPLGSWARLLARCTWASGSVVTGYSRSFQLAPLRVTWITQPTLSIPPSGSALTQVLAFPVPRPSVQLQSYDNNTGTWINVVDQRLPCSISAELVNYVGTDVTATISGTVDYFTDITNNGIATLTKVGVVAPTGFLAHLVSRCTWVSGAFISSVSSTFQISDLRIVWLQQPPLFVVSSGTALSQVSAMSPAPVIRVQYYDNSTWTWIDVLDQRLPCSVGVTLVGLGVGNTDIVASISGTTDYYTDTTDAGRATLSNVGIVAPFGYYAALTARCTWLSGISVTGTSNTFQIAALRVNWMNVPASVVPSGPTAVQLVPVSPPPSIIVQYYNNDTATWTDVTDKRIQCSVGVELVDIYGTPSSSTDVTAAIAGQTDYFTDPVTAGGEALLSKLGVVAPLNSYAYFTSRCTWISGGVVTGLSAVFSISPLRVDWLVQPALSQFASGTIASQFVPMNPNPMLLRIQSYDNVTGNFSDISYRVPCRISAESADPVLISTSAAGIQVTGTAEYFINVTSGYANITRVGIAGAFGVRAILVASCTWVNGAVVTSSSSSFEIAEMSVLFPTQPAASVRASGATSDTWIYMTPAPILSLHYKLLTPITNTSTTTTSGGWNTSTLVPLQGYLPCSIGVEIVDTNKGSTPQIVGESDYTTFENGTAFLDTIGFTGAFGARLHLSARCTWISGAIISNFSTLFSLASMQLALLQGPAAITRGSSADVSTWSFFTPALAIAVQYALPNGLTYANASTASPLSCVASVANITSATGKPMSLSSVQLVGVLDSTTDVNGIASWPQLGVSAAMGSFVSIMLRCQYVNGAMISVKTGFTQVTAAKVRFVTQPSAFVVPGTTSPTGLIVLSPPPAVLVYTDTTGTEIPHTASSIRCELRIVPVSVPVSNFVSNIGGDAVILTEVSSGIANFTNVGLTGPFGAILALRAICTWVSGEEIIFQSTNITLATIKLNMTVPTPTSTIPSSPTQLTPWTPAPTLMLGYDGTEQQQQAFGGTLMPLGTTSPPLTCTIGIYSSVVSGAGQITLQGDTSSVTDPHTSLVSFGNVGASGPFDSSFRIIFQCPWVTGQAITLITNTISFPSPSLSWGIPPSLYALYNTNMDSFTTQISYKIGNGNPSSDWSAIGINLNQIRCSLDAVLNGTSQPVIVSGNTLSTIDVTGTANFTGISLVPPPATGTDDVLVALRVSCQLAGLSSGLPLTAVLTIQSLTASFFVPPPTRALPSSQTAPIPFTPAIQVGLLNHTGGLLVEDGVVCTISVAAAIYPPGLPLAKQRSLLLGFTRANAVNGIATFSDLAMNAPFGSQVTFTATCSRQQGGTVLSTRATVEMDVIEVGWAVPPESVILQNTPSPLTVIVHRFAPDINNSYAPIAGTDAVVEGVPCTLRVDPVITDTSSPYYGVVSLGSSALDGANTTDSSGQTSFRLSLRGIPGAPANITVVCALADQYVPSVPRATLIDTVEPYFTTQPPLVWLPTSGLARTPMNFPTEPQVLLRRKSNGARVDARYAICRVGADGSAKVLEPPLEGYKMVLPVSITDAADTDVNASRLVSTTPIHLPGILVGGDFRLHFNLTVNCIRGQGDQTSELLWPMRMFAARMRWREYLPSTTISQQTFHAKVEMYDEEADEATKSMNITLASSSSLSSSSSDNANIIVRGDTIILDRVSICTMNVITDDTSVIIQNADGVAESGIVAINGASLSARSGDTVQGIVTCTLGEMTYSEPLAWSILMEPCSMGFAPTGGGGYTCGVCGSGTYSDGGASARCIKCPAQGVTCAGGILNFLPGFYRTPDTRPIVDELTEFRPCLNVEACIVETTTTNRSAALTHACAEGYRGPLCAVCQEADDYAKLGNACHKCWPAAANWVITSFFPILFLIFAFYISVLRKPSKGSRSQIIFRILLTYFQTLGTVGSVYLAKGTSKFREYFGFSDMVGDSVLSASPLQCALQLGFRSKFALTIGMPFIIAILSVIINILVIIHRKFKKSGFSGLTQITPASPTSVAANAGKNKNSGGVRIEDQTIHEQVSHFFATRAWIAPVIFVLNLGYASITTTSFSALNCLPFTIGGKTYMSQDLKVECYTPIHDVLRLTAGFVIALFGMGFPIMFAIILKRNEANLLSETTYSRFGFLYDGYSLERGLYFWESIIMMRKAFIVFIGSIIHDSYYQIVASITLMTIALTLQAMYSPFRSRSFNAIESAAIVTVILTQLISIFYLRYDSIAKPCEGADPNTVVDNIGTTCSRILAQKSISDDLTTAALVLLNGIFVITMVSLLFKAVAKGCYRQNAFVKRYSSRVACIRRWCDGDTTSAGRVLKGTDKMIMNALEGKSVGDLATIINANNKLSNGGGGGASAAGSGLEGFVLGNALLNAPGAPGSAARFAGGHGGEGMILDAGTAAMLKDDYDKDHIPKARSANGNKSKMALVVPGAKIALANANAKRSAQQQLGGFNRNNNNNNNNNINYNSATGYYDEEDEDDAVLVAGSKVSYRPVQMATAASSSSLATTPVKATLARGRSFGNVLGGGNNKSSARGSTGIINNNVSNAAFAQANPLHSLGNEHHVLPPPPLPSAGTAIVGNNMRSHKSIRSLFQDIPAQSNTASSSAAFARQNDIRNGVDAQNSVVNPLAARPQNLRSLLGLSPESSQQHADRYSRSSMIGSLGSSSASSSSKVAVPSLGDLLGLSISNPSRGSSSATTTKQGSPRARLHSDGSDGSDGSESANSPKKNTVILGRSPSSRRNALTTSTSSNSTDNQDANENSGSNNNEADETNDVQGHDDDEVLTPQIAADERKKTPAVPSLTQLLGLST